MIFAIKTFIMNEDDKMIIILISYRYHFISAYTRTNF